jgi:four helix bundle protein
MPAKDHRELRVYQLAFDSAVRIYETTKRFPVEERYSLTDQIRRSSRSVCTNIAEAWRRRRYPKSFINKLSDADGEAARNCLVGFRSAVWIPFSFYPRHKEIVEAYDHICSQFTVMLARRNVGSGKVRCENYYSYL